MYSSSTYFTSRKNINTIFVSIASYRDPKCSKTLIDLYDKAKFPQNVYVGICQQNDNFIDSDCINSSIEKYKNNIRITRLSYKEAKGPTYARYRCSKLYRGEHYFMQIDSHTLFVKDWDTLVIDMIHKIKKNNLSNKPVISYYPKDYSDVNSMENNVPRICKSFFNSDGIISFLGANEVENTYLPVNTPYLTGGFFFCEAYFLKELPFDPSLDYLFVGEEILHSVRFYTHGWDIFSPNQDIVYHYYTRSDEPKIWTDLKYSDENAINKVKQLLKLTDNLDKDNIGVNYNYGLGNTRSLEDYYNFAGINIQTKKTYKDFCHKDSANYNNISINDTNRNIVSTLNSNYITIFILIIMFTFLTISLCSF
jgi:[Skp1-protein]-hydroxyproline N-acetylglucosaminyltransferase